MKTQHDDPMMTNQHSAIQREYSRYFTARSETYKYGSRILIRTPDYSKRNKHWSFVELVSTGGNDSK